MSHHFLFRSSSLRSSLSGALLLAGMVFSSFGAANCHAELIVHLKLDEGTGTSAANTVPGGAAGTLTGAGSGWSTSVPENFIFRSAYRNNGETGAYLSLPGTSVGVLDSFTITGWINALEFNGSGGSYDRILAKNNFNSNYFDLGFYNVAGGGVGISLLVANASGTKRVTTSALTFSEGWLFFAATRNTDTGEIELYIGRPDEAGVTRNGYGTDSYGSILANTSLLTLGNVQANIDRNGEVLYSDFRIYDTALTATEIEAIRLQAIPEPATTALLMMAGPALLLLSRLKSANR